MYAFLTDITGFSVFILPITPTELTETASNSNYKTLNTLDKSIRLIDNRSPKTYSWSSVFPVGKKYTYVSTGAFKNGWLYKEFIQVMQDYNLPIRLITATKDRIPVINTLASIDEFTWKCDKVKDINYSIKLTEVHEEFYKSIIRDYEALKGLKSYINIDKLKSGSKSVLQKYGLMP